VDFSDADKRSSSIREEIWKKAAHRPPFCYRWCRHRGRGGAIRPQSCRRNADLRTTSRQDAGLKKVTGQETLEKKQDKVKRISLCFSPRKDKTNILDIARPRRIAPAARCRC
jgi:hypothetical protein